MTNLEFSNEFDILYNSIATSSAPGIDLYEKSVYLTKAQLEIVKNYYNPKGNKYQEGFEQTEKRRRDLVQLVEPYVTSSFDNFPNVDVDLETAKINPNSKFVRIPSNTFLIIYESAIGKPEHCESREIKIKPVTHDEYAYQIKNPFKKPSENIAWRFDLRNIQGFKVVEILSEIPLLQYRMRYIKYPKPIVLTDLSTAFPGEGLTIAGVSQETQCELNESIHVEILDRAVQLALRDYKPQNLESKMQLDLRNE
jgi:hypothetical protein